MSDTGGELAQVGGTIDPRSAEQVKAETATRRAHLLREQIAMQAQVEAVRADLEVQRAEMERQRREMESALNARRHELELQLAPMLAELKKLEEISWTVDLYLGRHETVTLLRDGAPASADTPIAIRQCVLFADEESLLYAGDPKGGFDWRDMDTFTEWLLASPENLDRVLPDQRGVIVVAPTRQVRRTEDPFRDEIEAKANLRAHWLIRNGERLYLMVTDPELEVGERILPKRTEFAEFFEDRFTHQPLRPGSGEWVKAEESADKRRRHFMRLMLILQGLIDRSVAFHPLPVGGVNLMSTWAQDAGHVILVDELDMVLGDGRKSFKEWQRELNSQLRIGMRVVLGNGIGEHSYEHGRYNSRLSPASASHPPTSEPLMIEGTRRGGLVVRYARTDMISRRYERPSERPGYVYRGWEDVAPSQRASALLMSDDPFVLPFDLASIEDLEFFLNSRSDRKAYEKMVPVIVAALKVKRDEYEAEAPLRALLRDTLVARGGIDDAEVVEGELDDLVRWWKIGQKTHHALVGDAELERKACEAILREWRQRRTVKAAGSTVQKVVAAARALDGVMAVAMTRSRKFLAIMPAAVGEAAFVTLVEFDRHGVEVSRDEWTTLNTRTIATMKVLWQSPAWESWDLYPDVSDRLTGPEEMLAVEWAAAHFAKEGSSAPFLATRPSGPYHQVTVCAWVGGVDLTDFAAYKAHREEAFVHAIRVNWTRTAAGVVFSKDRRHIRLDLEPKPANLVWADTEELQRVKDVLAAHRERHERERQAEGDEQVRVGGIANAAIEHLRGAWVARLEAQARSDFAVDFGADAATDEALVRHHLGTLRLESNVPKTPHWFRDALDPVVRAGVTLDGKTMREVVDIYATLFTDSSQMEARAAQTSDLWLDLAIPGIPEPASETGAEDL